MESLNLLRYLIIRDKVTENQVRTGFNYPSWVFALFFVYIFFLLPFVHRQGSGQSFIRLRIHSQNLCESG